MSEERPKISIVTAVYNCRSTIEDTIRSVRSQSYDNVEHVVIDGASTDGTTEVLRAHADEIATLVSEPDRGIYDALNKGIERCTGDIVGILHADDFYANESVLAEVAEAFRDIGVDAVFADVEFVDPSRPTRVVRHYSSKGFSRRSLARGMMPAHPTLFVRRSVYERLGRYSLDYKIASDFDMIVRMFGSGDVPFAYLPRVLVRMRTGGLSTRSWRSNLLLNREILAICRAHGIRTNVFKVYSKYLSKAFELVRPALRRGAQA